MAEKKIKSRVQVKRGTKAEWDLATTFSPLEGEIIFYTDLNKIKIGKKDGSGNLILLKDLPFVHVDKSEIDNWAHNHDERYYTETEVDTKLANKLNTSEFKISGTVTKAIGGIAKDKIYTNADLNDVLSDLLFPYVAPTMSSITLSAAAGTFEYGTTKKVSKVTPNFTKGSKNITSVKIGTTSGGADLYSGTSATSGTAITLTTNKTYDGTNGGTIYCTISDGTTPVTKSASISYAYYNYVIVTNSTTKPTSKGSGKNLAQSYEVSDLVTTDNSYIWFLMPNQNKKQIQEYAMNQWNNVNTTSAGSVTFTTDTGKSFTYYAYRTDKMMSNTSKYRIN